MRKVTLREQRKRLAEKKPIHVVPTQFQREYLALGKLPTETILKLRNDALIEERMPEELLNQLVLKHVPQIPIEEKKGSILPLKWKTDIRYSDPNAYVILISTMKELSPNRELIDDVNKGKISYDEFLVYYEDQLMNEKSLKTLRQFIMYSKHRNVYLVSNEKNGKRCAIRNALKTVIKRLQQKGILCE